MNENKAFRILFILIFLLTFSACSIKPPQVDNMIPVTYTPSPATIQKVLEVTKVSGKRIENILENDADTREIFRRAVVTTLENKKLFNKIERVDLELADYELSITILDIRINITGGIGKGRFETRLFVSYKLIQIQTNKIIWQKNILNEHYTHKSKHGANTIVVGFEGAAKENISKFITQLEEDLNSLQL